MNEQHEIHGGHDHAHGPNCGHQGVKHAGHVDYLHDGHLHHAHAGHIDEHTIELSDKNPNVCTPQHSCGAHDKSHQHGASCGHEAVPHGDHIDYLVKGHLHHPDGDHCDNHGPVELVGVGAKV